MGLGTILSPATADNYDSKKWNNTEFYLIDTVDFYYLPEAGLKATLLRENFLQARVVGECVNVQDRATGVVTTYDADFKALGTVDSLYDADHVTFDLVRFEVRGKRGYRDAQGNTVVRVNWDSITDFYGDYCMVKAGEAQGLVDKAGNIVIPAKYDAVTRMGLLSKDLYGTDWGYVAYGYACVEQDGKVGYVKLGGVFVASNAENLSPFQLRFSCLSG